MMIPVLYIWVEQKRIRYHVKYVKIEVSTRIYVKFCIPSSSWVADILVSISDVDFCLLRSRDLELHLEVALSWQSKWTFILHSLHLSPCRVCPKQKINKRHNTLFSEGRRQVKIQTLTHLKHWQ